MKEAAEMITGQDLLSTLRDLVRSRKICRMEIPGTDFSWFTLLLGLEKKRNASFLFVHRVPGFEKALRRSSEPVIAFEFLESGGIPCRFRTYVSTFDSRSIRVEVPEVIQRVQRRSFFRMKAPLGSEVLFRGNPGGEERGTVKDYSLGGAAVLVSPHSPKGIGERIEDLLLRIPREKESFDIRVRLALVRRISTDISGRLLCALEFIEMEEGERESLWHHLIEEQRSSIRKVREL